MYKKAIDFSILTFLNLATSWMPTTSDNFPTAFGWFFFFLWLTISLSSHMSFLVFILLHFGHDQVSLTVNTEANPLFILNLLWILYELIFACDTLIDIHRECKYHSSSGEKPTSASVFTYTVTQDVWFTSQGSFLTTSKFWLPSFTQCPVIHIFNHNPLMPSSLNSSQPQRSFTTILKAGDILGEGAYLTYIPIYNMLALFMKFS